MQISPKSFSFRDLLEFRDHLELGDGLFEEITGIGLTSIFRYRRGKLKAKPALSAEASERVERCHIARQLALELCGDEKRALDWLYADSAGFGGKSPIDLAPSHAGLARVQSYIEGMRSALATHTPAVKRDQKLPPPVTPAAQSSPNKTSPPDSPVPLASEKATRREELDTLPDSHPSPARQLLITEASAPAIAQVVQSKTPPPPDGAHPTARIFRLKDPLATLRKSKPDLTLKDISNLMIERGLTQFKVQTHASRLANSYTWATWAEVLALAEMLGGDPYELGSVWNHS